MKITKIPILLAIVCLLALTGCSNKETGDLNSVEIEGLDELEEIQVISREEGSGTRSTFAELAGFLENNEGKPDRTTESARIAENAEMVCAMVSESESAIGYLSLSAIPDNGNVKALNVNGVTASLEEKAYPLSRTFYLAYSGRLSELEEDFLIYVHGAGQALVAESFIPIAKSSSFLSNRAEGTLLIGGSTSVAPLMEELAAAYMKINPNAQVVVEETDSGDGLTKAMSGELDLAMSSRELKDYEMELLDYEAIARDEIAVIVNSKNPLENLTIEILRDIFTGEIAEWEDINR